MEITHIFYLRAEMLFIMRIFKIRDLSFLVLIINEICRVMTKPVKIRPIILIQERNKKNGKQV